MLGSLSEATSLLLNIRDSSVGIWDKPFYLIIFCLEYIPNRAHSKKDTFQKGHIPFEHIPKRTHSIFIIFQIKHIPNQAHSKSKIIKGHISEQFWSLQPIVQANTGSSKSARRGAAAAADKSISSYPRSQSSRVPMRSAEGWTHQLELFQ